MILNDDCFKDSADFYAENTRNYHFSSDMLNSGVAKPKMCNSIDAFYIFKT